MADYAPVDLTAEGQVEFELNGRRVTAPAGTMLVDAAFAQAEDVPEHPAFVRREPGIARPNGIENVLQIGACNIRLPPEQRAQRADEPILAAVARRRHRHRQVSRLV